MSMCNDLLNLMWDNQAIMAIAGIIVANLVDVWPWYAKRTFAEKRVAMFLMCCIVPVTALLLGAFVYHCPSMAWTRQSLLIVISNGCIAFAASQGTHLTLR